MQTTTDITVQKSVPSDDDAVSRVLSLAFFDDPVFRWALPDDELRRAVLPGFFDAFVAVFARHDETYVTGGDVVGAALWAPPGVEPFAEGDDEAFAASLADVDPTRMFQIMELLGETHPHEDTWYLNLAAVDPAVQGRGVGSALLRAVLDQADAAGAPAYLEATSEHNRRLYERHGFVVTAGLVVADCPPLYAMWRRPS